MGVYIYNVRKGRAVNASFEGREVAVFACSYTCKLTQLPSQMWPSDRRRAFPYDALMARLETAWGGQRPEFVVIADNEKGVVAEGQRVYRWEGGLEWSDCDKIPGECVGVLRKQGRKWVVGPVGEDRFVRVLAT